MDDILADYPYLDCEDDGLRIRDSGEWAVAKLDYLHRYLNVLTISSKKQHWECINYIDLFSGPGKCKIRKAQRIILGSPLLAVNLQLPFDHYYFVDMDVDNIDSLRKRCSHSAQKDNIDYLIGDSNLIVSDIVKKIKNLDRFYKVQNKWSSLNLAFIDPQGFELEWNTIVQLSTVNRMDLLIYYPKMGITRESPKVIDKEYENKIDRYFGTTKWRDIYKDYQEKKIYGIDRHLIDLYKENLTKLGYLVNSDDEPLMRNKLRGPLYRLLFVSKNPLGIKLWKEVTTRDVYGQRRLL